MPSFARHLLLAATSLGLASCAATPPSTPPATAPRVELARYQGTWHEIARLPMPFQQAGDAATATYGALPDGTLSVHNVATSPDGQKREIRGRARVLNPGENSKLLVTFDAWFSVFIPKPDVGNYWILHVDPDYQTALVGTPDRRYLWLLARTPTLPAATETRLLKIAQAQGYDTTQLVRPKR